MPEEISIANAPVADSITLKQSLWLYALASNLSQGVLLVNDEQQIVFINQLLCNIFQLQQSPATFTGQHITALLNKAAGLFSDTTNVAQKLKEVIEKKQPSCKEKIVLTDNRILSADFIPVWLDKNITGNLILFSDETEQIKSSESVEQEKQFYKNILNHLPEEVAVYSPSAKYIYVNPGGVNDDMERKWLIGKTDVDYFVLKNKDAATARNRTKFFEKAVSEKKEYEWEETAINDKDVAETFLRKLHPVTDEQGNIKLIIGRGVNISERKKIEAQLQLNEKKFRDLFNYSRAIICTHDESGKLLSANPALCEITGYTENEIVGKNIQDFLLPEDKDKFDESYMQPMNSNKKAQGLLKILKKSGEKIYLSYQNYKVEEPREQTYIVASAQDITDRIIAEKNLKAAQQTSEETAKSKEKFLADMSHEIRTPMNGILGISSLLQKTNLNKDQQFYLGIIQESAQKLLGLINKIQDVTGSGNIAGENSADVKVDSHNDALSSLSELEKQSAMSYPKEETPVINTLPKLKVLLAEDNDINQFLAKNMLRHWGFESDVANTGEEVLQLLNEKDFDLILMDIQMPLKNGIEVTRDIRQLGNPAKRNIPIIALTALTVKGEEKKYIAAGMDACLTKPFKERELYNAIEKVITKKADEKAADNSLKEAQLRDENKEIITEDKQTEEEKNIPAQEQTHEEKNGFAEESHEVSNNKTLYDLSYLRSIQGSSTELVNKLMEIFIRTVPPTANEMVQACETQDWDTVKKLAHKIKSSVNTMGLHSVKPDVKLVEENAASRQQLDAILPKAKNIENVVTIAAQQLQAELESQLSINHS